jgi:hypothetical protein
LLYQNIHITDTNQAVFLLRTLEGNTSVSPLIRCLVISAITVQSAHVLLHCKHLSILDFSLDIMRPSTASAVSNAQVDAVEPGAIEFCNALMTSRHLRHLVVRKPDARLYLTMPRIKYILSRLADALLSWNNLETANFAFKFADDSSDSQPPSPKGGPIVRLTHALSARPRLHTFAAHVPATWSEAILRVSTNKRLERIVLTDGRVDVSIIPEITGVMPPAPAAEQQAGVLGTGLFFTEARKHAKLIELIKAGTHFVRCRARSLDTPAGQVATVCAATVTLVSARSAGSLASASPAPSASALQTSAKAQKRRNSTSSSRRVSSSPSFHV